MRLTLASLVVLLGTCACRHLPCDTRPRPAATTEVPAAGYYATPGPVPAPLEVEIVQRTGRHTVRRVLLPPRVLPELEHVPRVHDPIEIRHYRPRPAGDAPRPLVFMFPILSNRMLLMREFATGFTRMGYDAAIVTRKELAFDPARSVERAEDELRVLVMRGRQALDWLVLQPGVDASRLAVCGISAGGIVGAALLAGDPRLRAGVLILAGGPMSDVMVDTTEGEFADNLPRVEAALGWSREDVRRRLHQIIRTDPVLLAPRIPREHLLLFIAERDDSVPTRNQWRLWEALGRPEAYVLPTGHYSSFVLLLPFILERAKRFLGSRLGAP